MRTSPLKHLQKWNAIKRMQRGCAVTNVYIMSKNDKQHHVHDFHQWTRLIIYLVINHDMYNKISKMMEYTGQ